MINLRTLNPLDRETARASVRNTRREVIAHEVARIGGSGVELAVLVTECAFFDLDGPGPQGGGPRSAAPLRPAAGRRSGPFRHGHRRRAAYRR